MVCKNQTIKIFITLFKEVRELKMMMNKVAVPYPRFILGEPVACLV